MVMNPSLNLSDGAQTYICDFRVCLLLRHDRIFVFVVVDDNSAVDRDLADVDVVVPRFLGLS